MKQIIQITTLSVLLAVSACTNESEPPFTTTDEGEVCFSATLQESRKVESKAIGVGENGVAVPLPMSTGLSIRKVQASVSTAVTAAPYSVLSANKGVLAYNGVKTGILQWDKNFLKEPVDFYAWTAPAGVTITANATTGTVDFATGNAYPTTTKDKDKLDNVVVTPLEQFFSAKSIGNVYANSPSVTLPFYHQVCKVSIYLRNWNNVHINKNTATGISIKFLSIPKVWTIAQTEAGERKTSFTVTTPVTNNATDLSLQFVNLEYRGDGYFTMYLPPLVGDWSFANAGEFCITYANNKYYGTLETIGSLKELKAGEHMALVMDLSQNYGVGVGASIHEWNGPDKEDIIYANPQRGIYSVEGFKILAAYMADINKTTLPDSLFTKDTNKHKTIRLYNNLTLTDMLTIGTTSQPFKDLTFDGQGYTITLPATAAQGLFGVVGDDATSSTATTAIKNLCIAGGNVSGTDNVGILADTVRNTTIENCHVVSGSIAGASVGGLVGTADAGTTLTGCSVETTGAISGTTGTTVGALVGSLASGATISNCFVVSASAAGVSLVGGTAATGITYSYCWNRSGSPLNLSGSYWGASSESGTITFDPADVFNTSVAVGNSTSTLLLDALNASGNAWVYVYGKEYPVLKKEYPVLKKE